MGLNSLHSIFDIFRRYGWDYKLTMPGREMFCLLSWDAGRLPDLVGGVPIWLRRSNVRPCDRSLARIILFASYIFAGRLISEVLWKQRNSASARYLHPTLCRCWLTEEPQTWAVSSCFVWEFVGVPQAFTSQHRSTLLVREPIFSVVYNRLSVDSRSWAPVWIIYRSPPVCENMTLSTDRCCWSGTDQTVNAASGCFATRPN